MKAILKYSLYRRLQPTNEVEANGYLKKDAIIETNKVAEGKELDGVKLWFHATDGFYYWGGGVKVSEGEELIGWETLSPNIQQAVLYSIVNDESYKIEKNITGLLGYGIGYKNDNVADGLALSIFVDAKIPVQNIDKTIIYLGIKRIPTDVKVVKQIDHHLYNPNGIKNLQPDQGAPMQMGGSISPDGSNNYGTRGFIVRDKQNNALLLTCFHVLLDNFKSKGEFPFAGSVEVLTNYPCVKMNSTGKTIRKETVTLGKYNSRYDFALVPLKDDSDLMNAFDNRRFNGFHISSTLPGLLNQQLIMAGATSKMQSGKVLDTKATIFVGRNQQRFENVVVTEKISMPGDSGGPVIDAQNKLVGIIIAGNSIDRSFVLPIHNVIFQQGYKIDT